MTTFPSGFSPCDYYSDFTFFTDEPEPVFKFVNDGRFFLIPPTWSGSGTCGAWPTCTGNATGGGPNFYFGWGSANMAQILQFSAGIYVGDELVIQSQWEIFGLISLALAIFLPIFAACAKCCNCCCGRARVEDEFGRRDRRREEEGRGRGVAGWLITFFGGLMTIVPTLTVVVVTAFRAAVMQAWLELGIAETEIFGAYSRIAIIVGNVVPTIVTMVVVFAMGCSRCCCCRRGGQQQVDVQRELHQIAAAKEACCCGTAGSICKTLLPFLMLVIQIPVTAADIVIRLYGGNASFIALELFVQVSVTFLLSKWIIEIIEPRFWEEVADVFYSDVLDTFACTISRILLICATAVMQAIVSTSKYTTGFPELLAMGGFFAFGTMIMMGLWGVFHACKVDKAVAAAAEAHAQRFGAWDKLDHAFTPLPDFRAEKSLIMRGNGARLFAALSAPGANAKVLMTPIAEGVQSLGRAVGSDKTGEGLAKMLISYASQGIDAMCNVAIHVYTKETFLYRELNRLLRGGDADPKLADLVSPYATLLTFALSRHQQVSGSSVWRGLAFRSPSDRRYAEEYRRGKSIVWESFSSTTPDPDTAAFFATKQGYFSKIAITKGPSVVAVDISALNACGEEEILLGPGTLLQVEQELHSEAVPVSNGTLIGLVVTLTVKGNALIDRLGTCPVAAH